MITAAVCVVLALGYLFGAGWVRTSFLRSVTCEGRCNHDHTWHAMWVGVFWPFALPVIAGALWSTRHERRLSAYDTARARMTEQVRRLEKELGL